MRNGKLVVSSCAACVEEFPDWVEVLPAGPGLVSATYELMNCFDDVGGLPDLVVAVGTCGVLDASLPWATVYEVGAAVHCGEQVQWDVTAPYTVATVGPGLLSPEQVKELEQDAELMDCETYAYAYVCEKLKVPLKVFLLTAGPDVVRAGSQALWSKVEEWL